MQLSRMVEYDFTSDVYQAMCATAWIMFFLVFKNVFLLIILIIQRRKHFIYKIPEDADNFNHGRSISTTEDWSTASRIQRILINDVEYIPYFFFLLLIMFCRVDLGDQENQHYLTRVFVYGFMFTIARYLHTISYLIRNTYGRIFGFFLTILTLVLISIDHVYYMSKSLIDVNSTKR